MKRFLSFTLAIVASPIYVVFALFVGICMGIIESIDLIVDVFNFIAFQRNEDYEYDDIY